MISANGALTGSYDYAEVARSVLIAIAASYAALDLAGRVSAARGRVRLAWLGGGAIAMGIGIWEMHFKGMLAFHLPVPVEYHWPTVLASLLVAILASAVALYVASRQKMGSVDALTGSVIMGAAIAGMHYIGMAAMRLPAITSFSPLLVTCSILFAILFSLVALLIAFGLREESRWTVPRRLGSATVMGAAVSAMHYTGMAAASFMPASAPDLSHAVNISPLANSGIAIVTLIVIVAAVATSSVDRRASAEVQRLNEELERRVAERTSQLEAVNQALRNEIVEREQAQEAVRRSEDRLRLVIDTLPALVWSKLPDGSADFLNQRFLEYTGLSVEEALGWGWMREFDPEDRAEEEWRAAFAAGEPFEREAQLRRADGEYRWFLLRAVPLRDELGNVVKWYGTNTDIEDRKRAEQELRQAEEHIRAILEYSPNWIFLKDTEGRYLLVNREIERVFGISQEQIKGKTDSEIFPPEQAPEYRANDLKVLRAGLTMEFEETVLLEDGLHTSIVHKFPLFDTHGNIYATGGVATDITERKRAEEARRLAEAELRESEARFRLVADSAPVMIWMSGTDKLCTYFNKPWLDFTGRSIDRELGNGWAEGVDPEDLQRCLDTYNQSFDRREAFRMEYHLRRHDGEFRWVLDIGAPRFNPDGSFAGYIGSCIDVTEQRRAEEQLHEAQAELAHVTRAVAMGEVVASIAHEVNQPLTGVVTNGNFVLRELTSGTTNLDKVREQLQKLWRMERGLAPSFHGFARCSGRALLIGLNWTSMM